MNTAVIIQARTSSSRLPRKVLLPLPFGDGPAVLSHVIRRARTARGVDRVIVATTDEPSDDPLVALGEQEGVDVFRGSLEDVLGRFIGAARQFDVDRVVRITADCPCIDPAILASALERQERDGLDYVATGIERTFPHGLDTEVVTREALEHAHREARETFEREHVTPYIYRTAADRFRIANHAAPAELRAPEIRITLDTEEDYTLLCLLFDALYATTAEFDTRSIVQFFERRPWALRINGKVMQKKLSFEGEEDELAEAVRLLELQELPRAAERLRRFRRGE